MRLALLTLLLWPACSLCLPASARPPLERRLDLPSRSFGGASGRADSSGRISVGVVGEHFFAALSVFLEPRGFSLVLLDCDDILAGALEDLDVLHVNREGVGDARCALPVIDSWVRAGGRLLTEDAASDMLLSDFEYLRGDARTREALPGGHPCGGATVLVVPAAPLSEGLPASWPCSGSGISRLRVWSELATAGDAIEFEVTARVLSDFDRDGVSDPLLVSARVGEGSVVAFLSNFGDWQPLDPSPRPPGCTPTCFRDANEETLLLNALCSPLTAPEYRACSPVAILGGYFFSELVNFLGSVGITVRTPHCDDIRAGALQESDVLYVNRIGVRELRCAREEVDEWVRGGGRLVTDLGASHELFQGDDRLNWLSGFYFGPPLGLIGPSGHVCGGNEITVLAPKHPVVADLPASWTCSGDPFGLFLPYAGIAPADDDVTQLTPLLAVEGLSYQGKAIHEAITWAGKVGRGEFVAFLHDMGDWQSLDPDRGQPRCDPTCQRAPLDEMVLLGAFCAPFEPDLLISGPPQLEPPRGNPDVPVGDIFP